MWSYRESGERSGRAVIQWGLAYLPGGGGYSSSRRSFTANPGIIAEVRSPSYDESSDRFYGNISYNFQNHYADSKPLMRMMMENQTALTVSDLSLSLMTKSGGGRRSGKRYEEEKKRAKTLSLYSEESEITISESNENEGRQKRKILKVLFV
ncbi:Gag-pol polyprotein-like protein [Hibiscus syriacus]|uniref:Gag-pol polyprotein-like protein n=1 Tax=Hibiscus syriacus TaxID=106335 RepID=A0A6A2YTT8_HIBSY|nr:Gag-pol polyprotein-like protein [Hibiscus syriacus]